MDLGTALAASAIFALLSFNVRAMAIHLGRSGFGASITIAVAAIVALNVAVVAALASLSIAHHTMLASSAVFVVNILLAALLIAVIRPSVRRMRPPEFSWRAVDLAALFLAATVALVVLQIVLYAPTGHDSMSYHLPKVAHLIDTGSVSPFAAQYPHVIETPWGYSYALYFLWLFGGDGAFEWFGIVQLTGLLGILGVLRGIFSDLASTRQASIGPVAAMLIGVLALSPMTLLQGPSTRNDLVTTAFCLMVMRGAIYGAGRSDEPLATRLKTAAVLVGFGLAGVLAFKPNLAIQAGIFVGLVALVTIYAQRTQVRSYLRNFELPIRPEGPITLVMLAFLMIGLSAPFVQATASNVATFGKITGPASESALGGLPGPTDAICRVALSLAYEGSSPPSNDAQVLAKPVEAISRVEQNSLRFVAGVCGSSLESRSNNLTPFVDPFGPEIDDITGGVEDNQMSRLQLHFLMVVVAVLIAAGISRMLRRGSNGDADSSTLDPPDHCRPVWILGLAVLTLLSASALAPWQYYSNSRFLLPSWLLVNALGLFVIVPRIHRRLQNAFSSKFRLGPTVVGTVALMMASSQAMWTVANNAYHPLPLTDGWGVQQRGDDWTAYSRAGSTPPTAVISFALDQTIARQCDVLGVTEPFIWAFPLWLAGRKAGIRIVDVDVATASGRFEERSQQEACLKFGYELDGESDREGFVPGPYGWSVWL